MNISKYLAEENIILDLKATSKTEAIAELVEQLVKSKKIEAADELIDAVTAREELCTTGLENGIAIPHPRHGQPHILEGVEIVFGRKKGGLEFDSMDGKPSNLLFLLCAENDTSHLRALARLSRMVKDAHFRKDLLAAQSAEDILDLFKKAEETLS
ncbi:PTS sugar transporter subunit IIA [bacterium]|nr:PTS sugar transporter subunit IIA [bacterium]